MQELQNMGEKELGVTAKAQILNTTFWELANACMQLKPEYRRDILIGEGEVEDIKIEKMRNSLITLLNKQVRLETKFLQDMTNRRLASAVPSWLKLDVHSPQAPSNIVPSWGAASDEDDFKKRLIDLREGHV